MTLNRYLVYKSGRTAFHNVTGKNSKRLVAIFGEKVLYMPLKTERLRMSKGDAKLREDIVLGVKSRSDEAIIGTDQGAVKARKITRPPKEQRWDADAINRLRGSPRRLVPGVESDHFPTDTAASLPPGAGEDEETAVTRKTGDIRRNAPRVEEEPRRMYVRKAYIDKYGRTPCCPGCDAIGSKNPPAHDQTCELEQDDEGRERLKEERARIERKSEVAFDRAIKMEVEKNAEFKRDTGAFEWEFDDIRKKRRTDSQALRSQPSSSTSLWTEAAAMEEDVVEARGACKRVRGDEPMEQKSGKRTKGNVDSIDIIKVCRQPRVTLAAEKIGGVRPGASLQITTQDEDGRKWDFSELEMRNRAVRKILNEKPLVLVTSPVCADWISETDASCVKRGIEEKRRRVDQSAMHLNFVCNLHMLQHRAGRYFMHEQPRSATSWEASCV